MIFLAGPRRFNCSSNARLDCSERAAVVKAALFRKSLRGIVLAICPSCIANSARDGDLEFYLILVETVAIVFKCDGLSAW